MGVIKQLRARKERSKAIKNILELGYTPAIQKLFWRSNKMFKMLKAVFGWELYASDFLVNYPIYVRNFLAPRDVYLMLGAAFTPKTFDVDPTLLDSKAIKALRLSGLYARQS